MSKAAPVSSSANELHSPSGWTARRLLLPREHGAWAMLLVPYLIGAAITGFSPRLVAGLVAVLLLFFSRPPLALLLKRRIRNGVWGPESRLLWLNFSLPALAAAALFAWLIVAYSLWWLLVLGSAGLALFAVHSVMVFRRRERSAAAELVGILMLTLTGPLAVYLARARMNGDTAREAVALWLLNAAYFGASVFLVKMKIRAAVQRRRPHGRGWRLHLARASILYCAATMALAAGLSIASWAPNLAPLVYLPLLAYAGWSIVTLGAELQIKREGVLQTGLAIIFAGLMILIYSL